MEDSISVIMCCNTCYMQKNALKDKKKKKKKKNILSIWFSEYAAKFTIKRLNIFTILYVYNTCYANIRLKRHI